MAQRPAVLAVYRELVELTRKLPAPDVAPALQEARAAVRRHAGEADPMVVSDLLKRMVARVTLLRMTTPRGAPGPPLPHRGGALRHARRRAAAGRRPGR